MFLAENLRVSLTASIAFDSSNANKKTREITILDLSGCVISFLLVKFVLCTSEVKLATTSPLGETSLTK